MEVKKMSKILPYALIAIIFISTSMQQGVLAAAPSATTTKAYQDFGLGFRVEYPANLLLQKGADNVSLSNPQTLNNASNYFKSTISVNTWVKEIGPSGLFTPPTLDTLARNVALGALNANGTVTNKTKLTIDNTSAYLVESGGTFNGHSYYVTDYLILKGNLVYDLLFSYSDQAKFLPVEQRIVKSFMFI
jgi:hypothetical protein